MAANESNPTLKTNKNNETTRCPVRPLANFLPSIWGDRFLSFSFDKSELKALGKAIEEPKEDVRRLILNTAMDPNKKLKLFYSVYRLGLTYLFAEEIDDQVDRIFKEINTEDYAELDLYTVSTNFQVFRLHGYKLSCDVFNKFKDNRSGRFMANITTDMRAILSFYESTQLKTRGEYILDEASGFTESQLKGAVDTLEEKIARKVKHALISPFHRGLQMVEARLYFSNYEEEFSIYNSLQNLANAHFRYLQLLHKEELHNMTKWGKDMEFHIITPYSRDRKPELYLWTLAMYMEPHYSQGRMVTSKIAQFVTVLDDTYDAYATIEELRLLTNAINRWDNTSAMERLPENIVPIYKVFWNEFTEFERLFTQGSTKRVDALKQAFQELARAYHQEAEWRHSEHIPSFQEYLKNGLSTSTYKVFSISSLMGMEEDVSKEALAWYETHPKILEALEIIGRLHNDVSTFEFEKERAQQQVTSVDAYMKTFGVPTNVAVDELKKMIENAWKDINEGCLKPTEVSIEVLSPILNLARMTDVVYKFTDNFTFPEKTIKEYITMLFISSIPM